MKKRKPVLSPQFSSQIPITQAIIKSTELALKKVPPELRVATFAAGAIGAVVSAFFEVKSARRLPRKMALPIQPAPRVVDMGWVKRSDDPVNKPTPLLAPGDEPPDVPK